MTDTKNIMIVGVGGQGTRHTCRILSAATINSGYDVKTSEVHGMSQRGGVVITYVKYGKKVYSPIIGKGEADVILAFEELEAYRALPYLKAGGNLIMNTQQIQPISVITGAAKYPENITEKLQAIPGINVTPLDALQLALSVGNPKSTNDVLIGVMAKKTDIPYEVWVEAIKQISKPAFVETSLKAFDLGYNYQP